MESEIIKLNSVDAIELFESYVKQTYERKHYNKEISINNSLINVPSIYVLNFDRFIDLINFTFVFIKNTKIVLIKPNKYFKPKYMYFNLNIKEDYKRFFGTMCTFFLIRFSNILTNDNIVINIKFESIFDTIAKYPKILNYFDSLDDVKNLYLPKQIPIEENKIYNVIFDEKIKRSYSKITINKLIRNKINKCNVYILMQIYFKSSHYKYLAFNDEFNYKFCNDLIKFHDIYKKYVVDLHIFVPIYKSELSKLIDELIKYKNKNIIIVSNFCSDDDRVINIHINKLIKILKNLYEY